MKRILIILIMFIGAIVSLNRTSFAEQACVQGYCVSGYYDAQNEWFVFDCPECVIPMHKKVIFDPVNKVKPYINAYITYNHNKEDYTYKYTVSNGIGARQSIDDIFIRYWAGIYDQKAPEKGWFMHTTYGFTVPICTWGHTPGVLTGKTKSGFSFRSVGLPAIALSQLSGGQRKEYYPPEGDDEQPQIGDAFRKVLDALLARYPEQARPITMTTIAPKYPPFPFIPVKFLSYIISLKDQSYKLGWIIEVSKAGSKGSIMNSLDKKLNNAQIKLEADDKKETIKILNTFVHEVDSLYNVCKKDEEYEGKEDDTSTHPIKNKDGKIEEYKVCNKSHITSEAYALLKYNTAFLINVLNGKMSPDIWMRKPAKEGQCEGK